MKIYALRATAGGTQGVMGTGYAIPIPERAGRALPEEGQPRRVCADSVSAKCCSRRMRSKKLSTSENAPSAPRQVEGRASIRASSDETKKKLVAAALKEFNQQGYFATDTNKIARRAGFAPQT